MTNISGAIVAAIVDNMVAGVALTEKARGGLVYITLESGSLAALEIYQAKYLEDYPLLGYTTSFKPIIFDEENRTWLATGSRYSQC